MSAKEMATDFAFVVGLKPRRQLTEEALTGLEECVAKEIRPICCPAIVFWSRVFDADAVRELPQNATDWLSATLLPALARQ